jgi:hypothetical protein
MPTIYGTDWHNVKTFSRLIFRCSYDMRTTRGVVWVFLHQEAPFIVDHSPI